MSAENQVIIVEVAGSSPQRLLNHSLIHRKLSETAWSMVSIVRPAIGENSDSSEYSRASKEIFEANRVKQFAQKVNFTAHPFQYVEKVNCNSCASAINMHFWMYQKDLHLPAFSKKAVANLKHSVKVFPGVTHRSRKVVEKDAKRTPMDLNRFFREFRVCTRRLSETAGVFLEEEDLDVS